MNGLIQPSAFWVAARRMLTWRFLIALVIIAGCFEAVARVAPAIVGERVHQPYLYSQRVCGRACLDEDRSLTWVTNGRGARGKLYRDEPIRIAVLGSSTSASTLLDQDEVWTERLRERLGPDVHVDNYARDRAADLEATTILRHLATQDLDYDVVVVMTHVAMDRVAFRRQKGAAFEFWWDWEIEGSVLAFPATLRRRVLRQLQQEPRIESVVNRILGGGNQDSGGLDPLDPANRELRREGRVTLVDHDSELSPEQEGDIRARARELVAAASDVAPQVWIVTQPVAYDEREVPGVSERWFTLSPAPGPPGTYLSNRSLAEGIRGSTAVLVDAAREAGASVVDLDAAMRPLLTERADLFEDKWHFSATGADVASRIIAAELQDGVDALRASEGEGRSPGGSENGPG